MKGALILALDLDDKEKALNVAMTVKDFVSYYKVGYPLILRYGIGIVGEISKIGKVIVDLKIADIPAISASIAKQATDQGATGVIVHGFVGRDVLKEVKKVSKEVYVVSEMSHPGSLDFMTDKSESIAKMAKEEGADGLVAPATRPERIRVLKEISGLKILSPGVGVQGGDPTEAIRNGADFLIVGRSIIMSPDPLQKVKELMFEK